MLVELRAENYAVIDHAIAVFGPGLNLLTGETGAGKSILVDALALLMGGKSSTEVVRHGATKAVVACVFESTPNAETILEANGIDSAGNDVILRREILSTGKGRVFVNNQPATVTVLKQLAPELALVHAQTESLTSFDQAQQRILLDRFAGISTEAIAEAHSRWRTASDKLDDLLQGEQDRLRMVDLWSYQNKEISSANLSPVKTKLSKPKSESWPTLRSSTPRQLEPLTSFTKAAPAPKLPSAPPCATSKSLPATTAASLRQPSN
jgi:DNA repair protein RecN (Recombination protein N)